jgi:hypothetical protein
LKTLYNTDILIGESMKKNIGGIDRVALLIVAKTNLNVPSFG